ncbi:uncharacterized protein LOC106166152 isoform X2 [Lingula anatina]|uniref:Uncharacterized protein LOC106166152 isoform X2 n=1 Tax=Lingula anatina TaxID=7574 RepID=A0A1S3IPT6_LINAN|nr:uncharacterized protein LOC106166152 isoform X2 [Lingula anatina]|eukprot:XP_013400073.1 uncharacterized protein LOC106166152 isoform X2 [Lingula anatina]
MMIRPMKPCRRGIKRNIALFVVFVIGIYCYVTIHYYGSKWRPLRPLATAEKEAQRLLKFITTYHYLCNSTVALSNRTDYLICTENNTGIDFEQSGIAYSVWTPYDIAFESALALNYSFQVNVITNFADADIVFREMNNTHILKTFLVANDNHDFTRNLYGQNTFNDILKKGGLKHIDILKMDRPSREVQLWEILHFMNEDRLLMSVKQLHIVMTIDKLDDDYLFNWYRSLYNLFYHQGFRLYHTSASSPLCLQVTVMESCVYWLSWIQNPGEQMFVMHPPADAGALELEEARVLDHINTLQEECHAFLEAPNLVSTVLPHSTSVTGVCSLEQHRRQVLIFSKNRELPVRQVFREADCDVYQFIPVFQYGNLIFKQESGHRKLNELTMDDLKLFVKRLRTVDVIDIHYTTMEWEILSNFLNNGILKSAHQLIFQANMIDRVYGRHPASLRKMYSELRRLEVQGFLLFHSIPCHMSEFLYYQANKGKVMEEQSLSYCYKLSFMKRNFKKKTKTGFQRHQIA